MSQRAKFILSQDRRHAPSYYHATLKYQDAYPPLTEGKDCDVCVIGGGFTGLSAALHLRQKGYRVILLEAHKIGWGASGRNGGQVGSGQRVDQISLEKIVGMERAKVLWNLAEESKQLVRDLVAKYNIDCDLKSGVLHTAHKARYYPEYVREAEHLNKVYGYDKTRVMDADEVAEMLGMRTYHGGVLDLGAAHLHPLNLALGVARACAAEGAELHEGSPVTDYTEAQGKIHLTTPQGHVTATEMVVACNGYLGELVPELAGKIMPINNFIVATEPLGEARARTINRDDVAVADSKFVINYFRMSPDHRLLFGGGENYSSRFPEDIASFVRKYMLQIYPNLEDVKIDYAWGGTLAITLNRLPHFGRLGKHIYYAQGYSGHGVALAHLGGKLIAEAINGTRERFDVMADLPTYSFPGGRMLRTPLLALGMMYYALRDRI
ncbi:NAD(P)/FAD-dependent oxidoreductase [Luteithermobacter gelatinilyticus]|uniref:NAD(P)/FAD-dependent oxidoreductase n=1 Tax=Luteithermobacter gelatinilyticus TaxID=2582913 RepID=UPI0011062176|nr:FAD-binding oxidoreductase [Luteithermobacter gelatinilyticus]